MKNLLNHIRRWNSWRKYNCNSWLHKILVLLGVIHSPTFGSHVIPLARNRRIRMLSRSSNGQFIVIDEVHDWHDEEVYSAIMTGMSNTNKDGVIYNTGRRSGKTVYLLQLSSYYNKPILVRSALSKNYLLELAGQLGIKIPEPITVSPKPIKPDVDFDKAYLVKTLLGQPMIERDYFVKVYKLEDLDGTE